MSETAVDTLESECDTLMERLDDSNVSPAEAQELASKFLGLMYRVNKRMRCVRDDLIPMEFQQTLAYSKAFEAIDSKANVSKAKAMASAHPDHLKHTGKKVRKENERDYWKGVYEVFNNAHIFYRTLCRD